MQRVNRACLTGIASKWQGAPSRSGGRHEWQPSRPHPHMHAAAICFSAAKFSLRSWLYFMHHGLGRRFFGGGVGDLGGRCRARADGLGMWDVKGGGGWGSGVDYLPG